MKSLDLLGGKLIRYSFVLLLVLFSDTWAASRPAHASDASAAVVEAVKGQVELYPEGGDQPGVLEKGSIIKPWDSIYTLGKSKVLLKWDKDPIVSLGEFSSLLYASDEAGPSDLHSIQLIEGIARVSADARRSGETLPFSVDTALASIVPEELSKPVDFIVEAYPLEKTVLTVITGSVTITIPSGNTVKQRIVRACQTVSVREEKDEIERESTSPEDMARLISDSTIPGTLHADLSACEGPAGYADAPYREPPARYSDQYAAYDDYPIEYYHPWVEYPYSEIRIVRRRGPLCVILVPGVGYFYVTIPVVAGWAFDPWAVEVYCRYAFIERVIYHDRAYLHRSRLRKRELFDLIHVARRTGKTGMLRKWQRELDELNIQTQWAARRMHRLQQKAAALEADKQKAAQRMPRGAYPYQAIYDSFALRKNLKVTRNWQERIMTGARLQDRLASLGGDGLAEVRAALAAERDPRKRRALRAELAGMKNNLAEGKVPVLSKEERTRRALRALQKERDPEQQARMQTRILNQLQQGQPRVSSDAATPTDIRALTERIADLPNPQTRQILQNRLGGVEQSVRARKQLKAAQEQIEQIAVQAAQEKDPRKRSELLGTITELSKPVSDVARPGFQLLQEQRALERRLVRETDHDKRETMQKALDDLKKKRREAVRQSFPGGKLPSDFRRLRTQQPGKQEGQPAQVLGKPAEGPAPQLLKPQEQSDQAIKRKRRSHTTRQESEKPALPLRDPSQGATIPLPGLKNQDERQKPTEQSVKDKAKPVKPDMVQPLKPEGPLVPQTTPAQKEPPVKLERQRKRQHGQPADVEPRTGERRDSLKELQKQRVKQDLLQQDQQIRRQQERDRQAIELKRRQQEDLNKEAERKAKEHQRRIKQLQKERTKLELQQRQDQQIRIQRERDRQAIELKRRQQEDANRQAERRAAEQRERFQLLQKERAKQEAQRQQQMQIRRQQERDRQAVEMKIRQQAQRKKQAETVRREIPIPRPQQAPQPKLTPPKPQQPPGLIKKGK